MTTWSPLEEGEEDPVQGRDPGREDDGILTLFECRQFRFQLELVRPGVAGVDQVLVPGTRPVDRGRVVRQGVGVRHHDRRADRARSGIAGVAEMDRLGCETDGGRVVPVWPSHEVRSPSVGEERSSQR